MKLQNHTVTIQFSDDELTDVCIDAYAVIKWIHDNRNIVPTEIQMAASETYNFICEASTLMIENEDYINKKDKEDREFPFEFDYEEDKEDKEDEEDEEEPSFEVVEQQISSDLKTILLKDIYDLVVDGDAIDADHPIFEKIADVLEHEELMS
ncbi:MAG: hypothetical protein RBS13_07560 [Bacteroidales bacterium]|nr:hypothetical protein [Bacteroidales bacterium]